MATSSNRSGSSSKSGGSERSGRSGSSRASGNAGNLASAALAGLAVGIAASVGKRFAMHSIHSAGKDWDEVLKAEHRAVEALFDKLAKTETTQTTTRTMLVMQIKKALTKHALEEENAVYPHLAKALGDGAADGLFAEHAEMKKALHFLGECDKASSEFLDRADQLRRIVTSHIAEEEILLDELKAQLTEEQNAELNAAAWKEGVSFS
jgi:hemerythrin superfamily protein